LSENCPKICRVVSGAALARHKLRPCGKFTFPLSDNFRSVMGRFAAVAGERLNLVTRALPLLWTHHVRPLWLQLAAGKTATII